MEGQVRAGLHSLCLIAALAALAGCAGTPSGTETPGRPAETVAKNDIVYAVRNGEELKLDLVRPAHGEGPFPGVVFLHGGGYMEGHRGDMRLYAVLAARRGYVGIIASYRLTSPLGQGKTENRFPAQLHDIKEALRWLRAHAEEYHLDPEHIGVAGYSAGGQLALMVGLTGPEDGLDGDSELSQYSCRVQAVVSAPGHVVCGSSSLSSYVREAMVRYLGGSRQEMPERYEAASPVTHISPYYETPPDPPVLAIFGGQDTLVEVKQAQVLAEAAIAAGVSHSILVIANANHDFAKLASPMDDYPMWSFLDKHLKETHLNK